MELQDDGPFGGNSRVRMLGNVVPALGPGGRVKRVFDIVVATVGLILLSPLILVVSAAVKLDSRGPIFVRETLYGYKNRAIQVHKFRSVKVSEVADQSNSHETRVGRVLRRTGIDEVPQLFNVLRGETSIVGPRQYIGRRDLFEHGHVPLLQDVKPGLTSSSGGLRTTEQRINDDLYYVKNWSLLLDIKIILMTLVSP
jgi:lipopolysaccharide/colanic/teichoic acid biosynthesis glycosyltransferase